MTCLCKVDPMSHESMALDLLLVTAGTAAALGRDSEEGVHGTSRRGGHVRDATIGETDLINRARLDGKGPADGFDA